MKLLHALLVTITLFIIATLTFSTPAHADNDDSLLQKSWNDIKSNSHMHFLDNLTPATFYDFKEHVMMAGGTSSFYSYKKLTADFGVVKSIDASTSVVPASTALPMVGLNLHIGEWLDSIPALHTLGANLGLQQGLLQYATAGAWFARDFGIHEFRYGAYTGLQVKW